MSKPKTEAQRQTRLAAKRRRQGLWRERIRRGELAEHLCRVCKTVPVYVRGGRCKACYLKQGQARSQRGGRPRYVCHVCMTTGVSAKGVRCKPCYLKQDRQLLPTHKPHVGPAKTTTEILAQDSEFLRSKAVARRDKNPDQYMSIKAGEFWSKPAKCQRCKKPIMYAGKCYACGTGHERELVRAEERTEVLV